MSYAKNLRSYPEQYFQIAAIFVGRREALEIPFRTRREAMAWRGKFNAFKALAAGQGPGQAPMPEENYAALVALTVRIEPPLTKKEEALAKESPCRVVIEHVDYTEAAKMIREALAGLSPEQLNNASPYSAQPTEPRRAFLADEPIERLRADDPFEAMMREYVAAPKEGTRQEAAAIVAIQPQAEERDAMEEVLEGWMEERVAKDESLHCSLCEVRYQCWTGIGSCKHPAR